MVNVWSCDREKFSPMDLKMACITMLCRVMRKIGLKVPLPLLKAECVGHQPPDLSSLPTDQEVSVIIWFPVHS